MKTIVAFLLGIVIGGLAVWVLGDPRVRTEARETEDRISEGAENARDNLGRAVDKIDEKVRDASREVAEETKDAVISGKIKAKLAADDDVSAFSVDVDTTDGLVTLSGKVSSTVQVDKAIALAKSVDGVKKVISTLQVSPD